MHNFTMWMNGREVQAELLDAEKARRIYESLKKGRSDKSETHVKHAAELGLTATA